MQGMRTVQGGTVLQQVREGWGGGRGVYGTV